MSLPRTSEAGVRIAGRTMRRQRRNGRYKRSNTAKVGRDWFSV